MEKAFLISVSLSNDRKNHEDDIIELKELARTAGATSVGESFQNRAKPDPATFMGKGKLTTVINQCKELECNLIILNNDISPTQLKNLQKEAGDEIKVIDRTGLILDIFTKHARTREAKTQVQLAHLQYLLPRLTRQWTHLERQMGGVGTRAGAGETQIEVDRRLLRNQITRLKKELKSIQKQRLTQNSNRENTFRLSLVGYTNAGKSTLMHALTTSEVLIEDKLFATLDTTTRKLHLDCNSSAVISDTVGFIQNLPHDLVASFRSTLGEIRDVDLLLKVYDASSSNLHMHIDTVNEVLNGMEARDKKSITVFNKIDLLDQNEMDGLKKRFEDGIFISAKDDKGINPLKDRISSMIKENFIKDTILIPYDKSSLVNSFYSLLNVLAKKNTYEGTEMTVEGDVTMIEKLKNQLK